MLRCCVPGRQSSECQLLRDLIDISSVVVRWVVQAGQIVAIGIGRIAGCDELCRSDRR